MVVSRLATVRAAERAYRRWRPTDPTEITQVFAALFGRAPEADEDALELIDAAVADGLDYDEAVALLRVL
jgi:hypothetical protein